MRKFRRVLNAKKTNGFDLKWVHVRAYGRKAQHQINFSVNNRVCAVLTYGSYKDARNEFEIFSR